MDPSGSTSGKSTQHGTYSYPVIQDEYSYFATALHLYPTYNVTATLASKISTDAGHEAGKKYPLTNVVAGIRSSFGASPLLLCDGESLQELRRCLDKDLKPLDCKHGESATRTMKGSIAGHVQGTSASRLINLMAVETPAVAPQEGWWLITS